MVDWYGRWTYEPDNYDKEQWCDMDYVAHWMFDEVGYKPSMDLYSFIKRLLNGYKSATKYSGNGEYFYAIPDDRPYPDSLMVNVPDFAAWVYDNGGLATLEAEYNTI